MIDNILFKIILYACNSYKTILHYKKILFAKPFNIYIYYIYNNDVLRHLFSCFFIEYWGLYEIQKNKSLIIEVFIHYKSFRKNIEYICILYDDVEILRYLLHNKNIRCHTSGEYTFIEMGIVRKIHKYLSWNVFKEYIDNDIYIPPEYSYEMRNYNYATLQRIQEYYMKEKFYKYNNKLMEKSIFDFLENFSIFLSPNRWKYKNIKKYFEYTSYMKYIQTDLDKYICNSNYTKYEFNSLLRNLLKFYLVENNKFYNEEIHQFLLKHNNFVFIHEYFTNCYFDKFKDVLLKTLKYKIIKNKNLISTLYKFKYLTYILYEFDKELIFNYYVDNYEFIKGDHINFVMSDIFDNRHIDLFYITISEKNKGQMNKKERLCIYKNLVKKEKYKFKPNLQW